MNDTVPIPAPWLRPPVRATYRRPSLLRRIARSEFARDVRSRLPIIPQAIGALTVVYFGILILRGAYVVAVAFGVAQ